MIESEEEYKEAEARLEVITGANPGTEEARELKALTRAIVEYLKKRNQPQHTESKLYPNKTSSKTKDAEAD